MDYQKIPDKALQLTKEELELLTTRLLLSLQNPPADEIRLDAIIKAERRLKELDNEAPQPTSEEDMIRRLRELMH